MATENFTTKPSALVHERGSTKSELG
ncbi:hypothetical protein CMUS01_09788 [Colletotrichum musicola]|uniref:Uncharacterized protein n=1 Tax=Colletotrichum musicola TaxID=2175873 RepID=A0A8H6K781_9PEZI|nr:hypothetical protein CMUS01_09788 [Colletotrichum musicola]